MTVSSQEYYSHGKLLITGEYLVLYGAEALGTPLKQGQNLKILPFAKDKSVLTWKAFTPDSLWFEAGYDIKDFSILNSSDNEFAERLKNILLQVRKLNPSFLKKGGAQVETNLEFDPEFGFGSSSTLIVNLAKWAGVDPFELQKITFKGSGYDIACGLSEGPVVYKLSEGKPQYESVNFNPPFPENIFFVYLGKKQRSLNEIKKFKKQKRFTKNEISAISQITTEVIKTKELNDFEDLMKEHEKIMSKVLDIKPVHETVFNNYNGGVVKSLGAWGGDFVLVTSRKQKEEFTKEMNKSGFNTVYGFDDIIL